MQETILAAEVRDTKNRNEAKNLRKKGFVPGIFYQKGFENVPIYVKELQLNLIAKSVVARIINLTLPNNVQYKSILKDVQYDPLTDQPTHFDLIGIKEDEKISLAIPVVLEGTSLGQRDGGLVQHLLHNIVVECLPKDIPESIIINISEFQIGDSFHVKDLKLENVDILTSKDITIVSIIPPTVEAAPVAAAAPTEEGAEEAKAEPEVVQTKGKKEEEPADKK